MSCLQTEVIFQHQKWPHLQGIADELMPLSDCEVGLLIGYNCARALVPRDVIAPIDNGPFGQRTDLGWGIVGIVEPDLIDQDLDSIELLHTKCCKTWYRMNHTQTC